ncbi:MAG: hypothetical protein NZ700_11640 [Gemmataceae bacterium]|nr:hypothetical protein [Gemmataceae bacterium]MDW8265612.1 hypothetical protein [Gemmataceae bacterium]
MKAEHRKELETNTLADQLGRWLQQARGAFSGAGWWFWGALALVVLAIVGWHLWSRSSLSRRSALWTREDQAASQAQIEELEKLAAEHRGTAAARIAQFQIARYRLQQGLGSLGSPGQRRIEGAQSVEQARDLYLSLIPQCSDMPLLAQEAMMGAAKAEEALIGVPKGGDSREPRATLAEAIRRYEELAAAKPESFLTQAARRRAEELKAKGKEIEGFYVELNTAITRK